LSLALTFKYEVGGYGRRLLDISVSLTQASMRSTVRGGELTGGKQTDSGQTDTLVGHPAV